MRVILIFLLFALSGNFVVFPQELKLKDVQINWQGLTFIFPEDVVIKETNLTTEKSLHVYPARREPFFVVIRKIPITQINFPKASWESEIFWHGENMEATELVLGNQTFTVYKADQIRNQNLLRANLWIWNQGESNYWVWILCRKDNLELVSFFESGRFLKGLAPP